jgi:hypothetical protein
VPKWPGGGCWAGVTMWAENDKLYLIFFSLISGWAIAHPGHHVDPPLPERKLQENDTITLPQTNYLLDGWDSLNNVSFCKTLFLHFFSAPPKKQNSKIKNLQKAFWKEKCMSREHWSRGPEGDGGSRQWAAAAVRPGQAS